MKDLIVYYSFTGNNEVLAEALRRRSGGDLLKIKEIKKRNAFTIILDLLFNRKPAIKKYNIAWQNYDRFIFIAPIWAGKIASPLKSFLRKARIHIKRYSFITVCGGNAWQKDKITAELNNLLARQPDKIMELWINDLLPTEKKDTIKYTSGYRIGPADFKAFETKINDFLHSGIESVPVHES